MDTPTRPSGATPAPATPIARRVAPDIRLSINICLRCAKSFAPGAGGCDCTATRKCERCSRLKKACDTIPQPFVVGFNRLVRMAARVAADVDDERGEADDFTTALRAWVAEVEAHLRKEVKHGGTHRPKGDEIALLQVQATNRLALATEGILDVLRSQYGHLPLGAADAQSDMGSGDELQRRRSRSNTPESVGPKSPTTFPAHKATGKRHRPAAPAVTRNLRSRRAPVVEEVEEEDMMMSGGLGPALENPQIISSQGSSALSSEHEE